MRITTKQIDGIIESINELTDSPITQHTKKAEGVGFISNIGHFYNDQAYGGNQLLRVSSTGGAVEEISKGHVSKKELYQFLKGFRAALYKMYDKNGYKKVQI